MEHLQLTQLEDQHGWPRSLVKWLPRIAVTLLFFFIGLSKFGRESRWVLTFEQIGFGQWLRYVTGILQLVGALFVLVPRLFLLGIMLLASTMIGAMAAWIFLLGVPFNAVFPGALLVGLIIVAAEDLVKLLQK
jgi:uncharacterized membrane protein YphA (DoxX/SURF4 family)